MQLYTKILIGMVVGTVLGFLVGPNSALLEPTAATLRGDVPIRERPAKEAATVFWSPVAERGSIVEVDGSWAQIETRLSSKDLLALRRDGVKAAEPLQAGAKVRGWVRTDHPGAVPYSGFGQTLVEWTEWLGRLFLALIKMVVVPLVFFSLTVGVASLGDVRRLGRLGGRTVLLFTTTTVLSLSIGVTLANVIQPGHFLSEDDRAGLLASYEGEADVTVGRAAESASLVDQLLAIVPDNPIASLANGDMLQIIFFAVLFGVALTFIDRERSRPLVDLLSTANDAVVMLVHIAMKLAPVGVAALLFKVVGTTGLTVLMALIAYAAVVLVGLALHAALVYGSIVHFGARFSFLQFLKGIRPALLLAFSTSSSSATLPVSKESVEDNLNVSNEVSSFVLPLGATINMDGTALYQGVAAIFIAQIYAFDLTIAQQLTVITSATLASVGAAGVPGAGLVTLAMVLTTIGVPSEGLALILGVDRLLDMFRTATNVVGDCSATALMARLEGNDLRYEPGAPGLDQTPSAGSVS
jgi:Na+/H+-dicarboxylate symporter